MISHSFDSVSWFTRGFEKREKKYYLLETEKEEIRRRVEASTAEEIVTTLSSLGFLVFRTLSLGLMMIMT